MVAFSKKHSEIAEGMDCKLFDEQKDIRENPYIDCVTSSCLQKLINDALVILPQFWEPVVWVFKQALAQCNERFIRKMHSVRSS